MAQVTSYADIPREHVIERRGGERANADLYPFIGDPMGGTGPNAFLVRFLPDSTSSTHFHAVDQVQIVTEGHGKFGRHEMQPFQLHFSRAYTPYGPLVPAAGTGWAFLNLRMRPDPEGAQKLSVAREKLLGLEDRRPFQINCEVTFPPKGPEPASIPIQGLQNDEGLAGLALTLPAAGRSISPSARGTDGQYIVIVNGELEHAGKMFTALTVIHVGPDEEPFVLRAGSEGLEAIILNFPRVQPVQAVAPPADLPAADKAWGCVLCNFVYDEASGLPEEGIAPGTRWQDVPQGWTCPDCGAGKSDFEVVEF